MVKGGRGNEEWKWVKSGGEAVQPPTVDRSLVGVDQSTNESSANPREERIEKRKEERDG